MGITVPAHRHRLRYSAEAILAARALKAASVAQRWTWPALGAACAAAVLAATVVVVTGVLVAVPTARHRACVVLAVCASEVRPPLLACPSCGLTAFPPAVSSQLWVCTTSLQ